MKKIFLILGVFVFIYVGYSFVTLGSTSVPTQDFIISKGDTLYSLPGKLNIDVNTTIYKVWIKAHHSDFLLQAGSYHTGD
jgi:hypothetical protein